MAGFFSSAAEFYHRTAGKFCQELATLLPWPPPLRFSMPIGTSTSTYLAFRQNWISSSLSTVALPTLRRALRHVKGLCGRCSSVWGPKPHTPPPLTHFIRVYSALLHTGKGGGNGESWTREGQQVQKAGSEKTTWLTLINTCRKALYR